MTETAPVSQQQFEMDIGLPSDLGRHDPILGYGSAERVRIYCEPCDRLPLRPRKAGLPQRDSEKDPNMNDLFSKALRARLMALRATCGGKVSVSLQGWHGETKRDICRNKNDDDPVND